MKEENEFSIKVKVIREGQPRAYADSEYEYEIEADCGDDMVKNFCTKVLRPCSQACTGWNTNDANSYFHGCYKFSRTGRQV